MRLILIISIFLLATTAHAQMTALTCGPTGAEKCNDVSAKLAGVDKQHFAKIPLDQRRGRFVAWLKPFALHLQAISGFPASVLIAQAGYHSEWGNSVYFRSHFNLFEHVCWRDKKVIAASFKTINFKVACASLKGDPKKRMAYSFSKAEDSILFYLSNLMDSRNRHFKNIQTDVKQAFSKAHPGVAHFRVIVGQLGGFSTKPNYRSEISSLIESERLVDLDSGPCQTCLFQARRLKMLLEKTGTPPATSPTGAPSEVPLSPKPKKATP